MKISLIMTGLFRTLPLCWPGMRDMFNGHEVDITVVTSEPDRVSDYVRIMSPDRLLLIGEPDISWYLKELPSWTEPAHRSAIIQAAKDLAVAPLVEQVRMAERPDMICRLRTDLEIITNIEPLKALDRHSVYIPRFNNWGGRSGQFMIGHPLLVTNHMYRAIRFALYKMVPGDEHFLKWHMEGWPVRRSRIKFNLLREDGRREAPMYHTEGDEPEYMPSDVAPLAVAATQPIRVAPGDENDVR